MRTSAFCRPSKAMWRVRGFTLIELLVVLAIIGLMAGLVVPSFSSLADRTLASVQRQEAIAELSGLSYRTYRLGSVFELSATSPDDHLPDGTPAVLLPTGWHIDLKSPIVISDTGICNGGELWLIAPDGVREHLQMQAPTCKVVSDAA